MRALASARLDLIPCDVVDTDALWRLWIDPDVRRYLWDDQVITIARARAIVAESVASARTSGIGLWTLRRRGTGDLVGFCGLRPTEDSEVELIYGLTPACWGQGLATEAARAVLHHALVELGLGRVVAATDPPNTASIRVLGRLRMEPRTGEPGLAPHLLHFHLRSPAFRAVTGPLATSPRPSRGPVAPPAGGPPDARPPAGAPDSRRLPPARPHRYGGGTRPARDRARPGDPA